MDTKETELEEIHVERITHQPSFLLKASLDIPPVFHQIKQEEQIKINKKKAKETRKERKLKKKKEKQEKKDKKQNKKKDEAKNTIDEHKMQMIEVAAKYGTSVNYKDPKRSDGLSSEEAQKRLELNGPNSLTQAYVVPRWLKFLKGFIGFFPLLLESAGILCFVAYALEPHEEIQNLYLGLVLWLVVILTAVFAFTQESKSSKAMEGFNNMAPRHCKVHRDGKVFGIDASDLVVGDIVEVKAGDKIPADLLLIHANELKVDNSSLTGEVEPQSRSTECTDENPFESHNLVFFGTLATEGEGVGIVVRTGDKTVIGTIAGLASSTEVKETPLRREIDRFVKILVVIAVILGIVFFAVGFVVKMNWIHNIVYTIGIIIANVPEGLLPTVTVSLSLTAKRLAKRNVLVKSLEAVETLGSCSTIASDKTGTLTQNRMTVVHLWYDSEIRTCDTLAPAGSFDTDAPTFKSLQRIATLCNRAVFDSSPENMELEILDRRAIGDASETALLKFCEPISPVEDYRNAYPKKFEIPFNSVNKWQLSIHTDDQGESFIVMKGAPERVIARCNKIMHKGEARDMSDEDQEGFQKAYEDLAGNGERVLGFAIMSLDSSKFTPEFEYNLDKKNFPLDGFTFVGLISLIDPPRPSVPDAIAKCHTAGVRVIMVTGDHPLTAVAIARQVGIIKGKTVEDIAKQEKIPVSEVDPDRAEAAVVKGSDLPDFTEEDWNRVLSKRQIVFARTSPEQKLQIVEQCQNRGEIVAVTGDGVNDSPALKKSDLGCAMGITGSDVSKEAADVILLDDNFASIVTGIEEGRIIFDNLKKSTCYMLSSNVPELIPFMLFVTGRIPLMLSAVLVLLINFGADTIPAISLAYETPESDIMFRKPRNPRKDRLVTARLALFSYGWLSLWQATAGVLAYFLTFNDYGIPPSAVAGSGVDYFRLDTTGDFYGYDTRQQRNILNEAQTAFFTVMVWTRIACLFVCRTQKNSVLPNIFNNLVANVGIFIELVLIVVLNYVPGIDTVFGTAAVNWKAWVIGPCFTVGLLATEEIRKAWIRRYPDGKVHKWTHW